ncbi:MAG: hypothetical protein CSA70_06080 [Rhodobacterales bacterium]|nr:MAG: hypothetical protein CSA70_06080 [Rhodobacterales bacterium]
MAAIDTTRATLNTGTPGLISRFFTGAAAAFVAWNDERKTRNAIAVLTDRELEDIGLVRGDLDSLAARR